MVSELHSVDTTILHIPNIHSHIAPKVQLDEQNYMAWVFLFRPITCTNDLMGIVDGIKFGRKHYVVSKKRNKVPEFNFYKRF
jgi:hypothetical protein